MAGVRYCSWHVPPHTPAEFTGSGGNACLRRPFPAFTEGGFPWSRGRAPGPPGVSPFGDPGNTCLTSRQAGSPLGQVESPRSVSDAARSSQLAAGRGSRDTRPAELTIPIGPEEALGLRAVAVLDRRKRAASGSDDVAKDLLRTGLRTRLDELGLPWAPSTEQVETARWNALRKQGSDGRARLLKTLRAALVVVALVVLSGGDLGGWRWTGFQGNEQVWDWLQLLLLPLAFATLPLWLRYADRISPARRAAYGIAVIGFAIFVVVGYAVPLHWSGFGGRKLWDWLTLLLLPATLVTVQTWSSTRRTLRVHHRVGLGALGVAWILTVIGGYFWAWNWTGYEGNTLWDWLQLMLLPLIFPTILAPALLPFVTGDVEKTAQPAGTEVATPAAAPTRTATGSAAMRPAPV